MQKYALASASRSWSNAQLERHGDASAPL